MFYIEVCEIERANMEVTIITSMNGVEQLEQNKITEFIGKIRKVITRNEKKQRSKKSKELDLQEKKMKHPMHRGKLKLSTR